MPRTDEEMRELLEQEKAKAAERLAWAIENGGLPTEADLSALYADLNEVCDRLEVITWRVGGITDVDGWDELEAPEVGFEQLGVLAVIADDVESRTDDFLGFAKTLRESIVSLDATRRDQQVKAEAK